MNAGGPSITLSGSRAVLSRSHAPVDFQSIRPAHRSTDSRSVQTLVDQFLADQQRLSAVDRFSRWHDQSCAQNAESALAPVYRLRLPATSPKPGQQFAFEVDLDACSGCKACVTACHSLNGLEDDESWRSVGLLLDRPDVSGTVRDRGHRNGGTTPIDLVPAPPALQHVTTACHHCVDPACLNGCPVLAYEKDPVTGIVRHLDDQCIGCSYCTLMCPYEIPRFSPRLGIVRKCDMCQGRLQAAEAPACVQGCPNGAIRIRVADIAPITAAFRDGTPPNRFASFLPDAPDPGFTVPTTRYVTPSGRPVPAVAANRHHTSPAQAHTPLVFFLILSQASVGVLVATALNTAFSPSHGSRLPLLALVVQVLSLAIATSHLGQPLRAWRSFLGWRRSWFSREILAFGAYTGLLAALNALPLVPNLPGSIERVALTATALTGVLAVATSVMIYAATRRAYWSAGTTFPRFFGTAALLGATTLTSPEGSLSVAFLALAVKGFAESGPLRRPLDNDTDELGRTRSLLKGPLRSLLQARWLCALLGISLLSLQLTPVPLAPEPIVATAALFLGLGEWLERYLFFTAVSPQRMPGGVPA